MRGRGWGGRGGGGGGRGWSRGTARGGVPVVDVSLATSEPERGFEPLTLAPQPEPEPELEPELDNTRLDPQALAFVKKAEMNPQAPEFRHHSPGAGQHLMSMLASPAPQRSLVPGPPAAGLLPGPPAVGHRLYAHPHAQRPGGALPSPPPRRSVYRALDDSESRAVDRALSQHRDRDELLTAP